MPRVYSTEFKAKAIRLAEEHIELEGCSMGAASLEVGQKLDIPPHTIDSWLKRGPVRNKDEAGQSESVEDELKRLRRENKELRRANEILKTASAFFAAELDRPTR